MAYFHNAVCPVCEKPLNPDDEVVVCPECGAPYHRGCYESIGHCLYEEKHGTGFAYLPDPTPDTVSKTQFIICPHCHKGNSADSLACENCGTPLPRPVDSAKADKQSTPTQPVYRRARNEVSVDTGKFKPIDKDGLLFNAEAGSEEDEAFQELRHQLNMDSADAQLDGYNIKEWLSYIGPSAPVYLFQFKRMDASRFGSVFSFSSFCFAPVYFMYRKMWAWGILALLGSLVCYAPSVIVTLQAAGMVSALPFSQTVMSQLVYFSMLLYLALSLIWAFFSYTLYRRKCIKGIGAIKQAYAEKKADSDEKSLYTSLAQAGGVSVVGGVLTAVLLFVPMMLSNFII